MKYRITGCRRKNPSLIKKGTTLRLAGRDKLKKIKPLPLPIEKIELNGGIPEKKAKGLLLKRLNSALKRLYAALRRIILAIYRGVYHILAAMGREICLMSKRAWRLLKKAVYLAVDLATRQRKNAPSLATLAGAATASVLVCAISGLYVIFGLFSFYARSYETVTIPHFTGKLPEEAAYDGDKFNLIIQYESNPDVAEGVVISQSPPAGVTRRIYERDGYYDIMLTVSRREDTRIPSGLVGMPLREAALLLHNQALSVKIEEKYSSAEEAGKIISVYPKSGSVARDGDLVTVTVGLGERISSVFVPKLTGLSETDAANRLSAVGLSVGEITYRTSGEARGTVIWQSVSDGVSLPSGSSVSFTVSAGEDFNAKTVPDLYGLSVEDAELRLKQVGLTVGGIYFVSSSATSNRVITQSPAAGTPISSSVTSVDLGVSRR